MDSTAIRITIVTVEDSVLTNTGDGPVAAAPPYVAGRARAADARGGSSRPRVAHQVRALRLARGWSLDELAGRSGVSKGMVVQIEGARTNPSVGTLCRLADAFGVTSRDLLEVADARRVHISAAANAPVLWRGDAAARRGCSAASTSRISSSCGSGSATR